jgi:predicted metal-dependent peptidase
MELPEAIQTARLALVSKRPYLASIIWSLIPVKRTDESGLDTMAVDAYGRWYINIDRVSQWPIGEIILGLIHEINHLLRRHHDRMITFSDWIGPGGVTLSNIAGDLEINDGLEDEAKSFNGSKLPKNWLYPSSFGFQDGLFAEEYAEKLLRQAQKNGNCFDMPVPQGQKGKQQQGSSGQGQGQGQKGKQQGQGQGDSTSCQKSQSGSGSGSEQGGLGGGKCGSCSGSGKQQWEEDAPAGQGGNSDVPGLSGSEIDVLRRQVAQAVKDHSSSRGDVPAGWKRWAEVELSPPKVPWTKELAAVIRRQQADCQGMVDYSWKRLSRRSTDEYLLPGLRRPKMEAIGVIDTSGSMSDNDLSACLREFAGVLKVVGLDGMRFIAVDAAAHVSKRVFKPSQITLAGGGGTDMRVGIKAAIEQKPKPDVVIVFTDGETPWPEAPYDTTKVIAVLVRGTAAYGKPPEWIRTLYVNG